MASITDGVKRLDLVYELGEGGDEVDVFELAPTLLAWGQLVQDSNRILNPNGQDIGVNVRPFKEGSFIVDIVLFPTTIQNLLSIIRPISFQDVVETLKLIGAIAGAGTSVLSVIRALRGKLSKVEEVRPGEIRYSSDTHNSVTVNGPVNQLLLNPQIIQNVYNVYGKPLETTEFQEVKTYVKGDEEQTKVTVQKADALSLAGYYEGVKEVTHIEKVKEREYPTFLNPKRGAFDGDGKAWSFWKGDQTITATIKDDRFLHKVERGEIRPNHNDLMEVRLFEKQKVIGTEVKPPTYEIREVIDYQPGGRQLLLEEVEPLQLDSGEPHDEIDGSET